MKSNGFLMKRGVWWNVPSLMKRYARKISEETERDGTWLFPLFDFGLRIELVLTICCLLFTSKNGSSTEDYLKDGSTPIQGLTLCGDGVFPGEYIGETNSAVRPLSEHFDILTY